MKFHTEEMYFVSLYRRSAIICFETILLINASGSGKSITVNITWVNGSSMYLEFLRTSKNYNSQTRFLGFC